MFSKLNYFPVNLTSASPLGFPRQTRQEERRRLFNKQYIRLVRASVQINSARTKHLNCIWKCVRSQKKFQERPSVSL